MSEIKKKLPEWVLKHKQSNTEIKKINGRFYLYGVKSVYDKAKKRPKKISLGILGSITEDKGFVASPKKELKLKGEKLITTKMCLHLSMDLLNGC